MDSEIKKIKILQVTAVDFTVKKFLIPLVDELKLQGYETHIACNVQGIGKELQTEGYDMKHIPFTRNMNVISHMKSFVTILKLLRKEKYDIVHSHTPVASLITRLAAFLTGTKLNVYTAHGFYFHENMNPTAYKIAYYLEKIFGKYLTHKIFFQSKEDFELALSDKFQKPENLIHISNGVSAERFNPEIYNRKEIREKLDVNEGIVITFIGRLVSEKGIKELIESFDSIYKSNNRAILLIVGDSVQGDRDGIDIISLINSLSPGAKQNVKLLGLRDDIPEILQATDLFVLPSYREGLPRSIIEAMAMAKPIVATDIRGCREEVFPGVNGELCEPKNPQSLANEINKIINDNHLMEKYGSNSRELFLSNFDEKVVLKRQLEVFNTFRRKQKK